MTAGLWTTDERVWAQECLVAGDRLAEIAAVAGRQVVDVALQLGVWGYVKHQHRWRRCGGPNDVWVGGMLREVARLRRRQGESVEALAAIANVHVDTMAKAVRDQAPAKAATRLAQQQLQVAQQKAGAPAGGRPVASSAGG